MQAIKSKKNKNLFSDKWWDEFLKETQNLTKTNVFKDVLPESEILEIRKSIVEILKDLASLRTTKYGYRIFVDGIKLTGREMEAIYDMPPYEGEDITAWANRVFEDKKFGMIINSGEKFNLQLSKKIALKTLPLLKKNGFPQEGVNFTLFIGNYGWTPLGIHQDSKGQNVIHFHLGPGPKTMYTWSKEKFSELVDINNFDHKNIEPLLPKATKFNFGQGDLYFMPSGEYHIGYSEELSLGLTFWTYNHTKYRFAQRLHNIIIDQFLKKSEDLIIPDKNDLNDSSQVKDILELYQFPNEFKDLSYEELISEMYKDLRFSIHSNSGYRTSPFSREEDSIDINLDEKMQLEKPFFIKYRESLDRHKLHVYVRGHKFSLNNYQCICDMIEIINNGEPFLASEIINNLDKGWSSEIGLNILELIYQYHGIIKLKKVI